MDAKKIAHIFFGENQNNILGGLLTFYNIWGVQKRRM